MTATAADYVWFRERFPELADYGYCLTWVRGLPAEQVLQRLGARERVSLVGLDALYEPAGQEWVAYEQTHQLELFVGATPIDGWTLLVEPNGFLGVTDEIIVPISQDTRWVSVYSNVNAQYRFCWVESGDIRLRFDPLFPARREGSHPDSLTDVMSVVGFDLRDDDEATFDLCEEAAFALAEHLTGVRLRPEHLEASTYVCGTVTVPRR